MNKKIWIIGLIILMNIFAGCIWEKSEELRTSNYILSCEIGCVKFANEMLKDIEYIANDNLYLENCLTFCNEEILREFRNSGE